MSEKNPEAPNICSTEPPVAVPVDVVWTNTDFQHENGLPVIGSCQVSSILSTLDQHIQTKPISLEPRANNEVSNISIANIDAFKSIPINIIDSDSITSVDEVKKRKKNHSSKDDEILKKKQFQKMLYFGCNLCPFICTKDSKISDHIKSVHNNNSSNNNNKKIQLKCPGCANVFYHKLSLRSHLTHDHEVARSDINRIVNSIVYVSLLAEENNNKNESISNFQENHIEETNDNINYFENNLPIDQNNFDDHSEHDHLEEISFLENAEEPPEKQLKGLIETVPVAMIAQLDYATPKEETIINELPDDKQQTLTQIRKKTTEELKRTQKCCISTCAVRMHNVINMAYHVKCHFGKVFRCHECNTNFVVWKTLQTHLWRSHNIDMELYSCDKCDYKTYSLAKLNNIHKLIHGNEKPFLCDLCGKGFKNPKQLTNHKIIHKTKSVEKAQKCTICERSFATKRLLKVHTAGVHQKLKPFCCKFCGHKASSNAAMKLHIRQHTGEKPFSCDSCDYATADHNSLRRHRSRHSGEKKYKCAHCDYACIQSSTYKSHLKTKHPGLENEYMFSCDYCQYRSINKEKYMLHMVSHKEKPKQIINHHANNNKFTDIMENICEQSEGLEERVVEIVTLNPSTQNKKMEFINLQNEFETTPDSKLFLMPKNPLQLDEPSMENNTEVRVQETPVALITKMNVTGQNSHCVILPIQNENIINITSVPNDNINLPTTTSLSTNNIQYYYGGSNVLLEVIKEDKK